MTNALEFRPIFRDDDDPAYLHFRKLAEYIEGFVENIDRQDEDLKTAPMYDHDLELRIGTNYLNFAHPMSERDDDEYAACVQYGATIMDVASSARKEPWALLALLLSAFNESWSGHSLDSYDLLWQVRDHFSASIAREALRRLSREEEAKENERKRLADPDEQAPIDPERDIPF